MPPEAVQAFAAMSRHFVRLDELHDAVGRRIAKLLSCESAMVTSGGFGALTLGTAACITGTDPERIRRLPDTAGMKNEVIVQKSHRFAYDHAVRNCGVRLMRTNLFYREVKPHLQTLVDDLFRNIVGFQRLNDRFFHAESVPAAQFP